MFDDILGPRPDNFKKSISDKKMSEEISNLQMESKAGAGIGAKKSAPTKAIDPGDPWGKDEDGEELLEEDEFDDDGKECACDKGEDACDGCGCLKNEDKDEIYGIITK